jgi:hypothetical protein
MTPGLMRGWSAWNLRGRAHPGQLVVMSSGVLGLRFSVRFEVERVDSASHDLEFRARFPLGIRMREHIGVRPVESGSRVQYG